MRYSLLFNALAAIGVVAILLTGRAEGRALELTNASGALTLTNSKDGTAILSGEDLRPGERTSGTVTIGNAGATASAVALEVEPETETPGASGARLWEQLQITVAHGGATVYAGRLAGMGRLALGDLSAGGARTYTVEATLPSAGNDLQGARLSVRFTWLAQPEAPAATPTPEPPVPTLTPVPVTPTQVPAVDPNGTVRADQIIWLPAKKSCLRRKKVVLRVRAPKGVNVKFVTVTVNGKRRGAAKSGRATITLRKLPRSKARVKATVVLKTGRRVSVSRTYKTC